MKETKYVPKVEQVKEPRLENLVLEYHMLDGELVKIEEGLDAVKTLLLSGSHGSRFIEARDAVRKNIDEFKEELDKARNRQLEIIKRQIEMEPELLRLRLSEKE